MHNPESFLEEKTHKILWDFEIQTDHLISARQPDLEIVNKKEKLPNRGLSCPSRSQSDNKRKQKER